MSMYILSASVVYSLFTNKIDQGWIYWGCTPSPSPDQMRCRGGCYFHDKAEKYERYNEMHVVVMICHTVSENLKIFSLQLIALALWIVGHLQQFINIKLIRNLIRIPPPPPHTHTHISVCHVCIE